MSLLTHLMGGGGQGCSDLNALQPLGNPSLRDSPGILQKLKISP